MAASEATSSPRSPGWAETTETMLPEVPAEPQPAAEILPWRGRRNVIAAAGTMLLDLLERA